MTLIAGTPEDPIIIGIPEGTSLSREDYIELAHDLEKGAQRVGLFLGIVCAGVLVIVILLIIYIIIIYTGKI